MITTMQMRRGLRSDFDPTRLLPGEWAVCIDQQTSNQVIYMCFAAGVVKRMGTYEDFRQQISEATQEIKDSYIAEFNVILDEVEKIAAQTAENKDTVIEVKDTILNTYLPQILSYKTSAENSASAASASRIASKASEVNARASEMASRASEANAGASETASAESRSAASEKAAEAAASEANARDSKTAAMASGAMAAEKASKASASAASADSSALAANKKADEADVSAAAALASEAGAASNAKKSQSYAVGGTGIRAGEDADNAKYYCERAQAIAGIGPATNDKMGLVKLAYHEDVTEPGTYALDAVQANVMVQGTLAHQVLKNNVALMDKLSRDNITSGSAITATGMYALDAVEKNASVSGTLAHHIAALNTNLRNNWVDIKSVTATAGVDIHRALYNMITKEVIIDAYGDVPVGNGNPILQYMKHTPSVEIKYFFCGMGKWNGDLTVNDWFPVVCTVNTGGQVMPWYPLNSVATHLRLKIHYICM